MSLTQEPGKDHPAYGYTGQRAPHKLRDALSELPPYDYYLLCAVGCDLSLSFSHYARNDMDVNNFFICTCPRPSAFRQGQHQYYSRAQDDELARAGINRCKEQKDSRAKCPWRKTIRKEGKHAQADVKLAGPIKSDHGVSWPKVVTSSR